MTAPIFDTAPYPDASEACERLAAWLRLDAAGAAAAGVDVSRVFAHEWGGADGVDVPTENGPTVVVREPQRAASHGSSIRLRGVAIDVQVDVPRTNPYAAGGPNSYDGRALLRAVHAWVIGRLAGFVPGGPLDPRGALQSGVSLLPAVPHDPPSPALPNKARGTLYSLAGYVLAMDSVS